MRDLSRKYQNEIVDRVRGALSDVTSFAARWVENAWTLAINLHIGIHRTLWLDNPVPIKAVTFQNAIQISRYFEERQLEVLLSPRIEAQKKQHDRLQEIFESNGKKPISLRELKRRHGIEKEEALSCVKTNRAIYGVADFTPSRGGTKSTLIFLRSNPPSKQVHTTQYET